MRLEELLKDPAPGYPALPAENLPDPVTAGRGGLIPGQMARLSAYTACPTRALEKGPIRLVTSILRQYEILGLVFMYSPG